MHRAEEFHCNTF